MTSKYFQKVAAFVLTSAICLAGTLSFAQNRPINGTVVDGSGLPVIGATVMVVGNTSIGAATNADGQFSLSVPAGSSITVSCIGYASQTVPVGQQSVFSFILQEDNEFLEETVVIGYGVQKKSDLTGSVASVRSQDLMDRSVSNAGAALQGKAAGGADKSKPLVPVEVTVGPYTYLTLKTGSGNDIARGDIAGSATEKTGRPHRAIVLWDDDGYAARGGGFVPGKHELYPFPFDVVELNPWDEEKGVGLKQNPGWE